MQQSLTFSFQTCEDKDKIIVEVGELVELFKFLVRWLRLYHQSWQTLDTYFNNWKKQLLHLRTCSSSEPTWYWLSLLYNRGGHPSAMTERERHAYAEPPSRQLLSLREQGLQMKAVMPPSHRTGLANVKLTLLVVNKCYQMFRTH